MTKTKQKELGAYGVSHKNAVRAVRNPEKCLVMLLVCLPGSLGAHVALHCPCQALV